MLNLETRMEILGTTIYQDSDRPNQCYYLPGSPHITYERGRPLFDLFSFRKGGQAGATLAGGFLNMTVDLGLGGLKGRVEQRLKDQFGDNVNLASVPFTKGVARVIALGEESMPPLGGAGTERSPTGAPPVASGPRFIEKIIGTAQTSLNGDNRAIFSFSLSEDGAAFFLGVLNGNVNARPVGVVYDLEYVGLLPAYGLEITIDQKSSYDYIRSRFTLGTLFFKADIDSLTDELQRRESIKIKEVSRTLELSKPEAVQERQRRIDQLVKDLTQGTLFQYTLVPGTPKTKSDDTFVAADPTAAISAMLSVPGSRVGAALGAGPSTATAVGTIEALEPSLRGASTGGGAGGASAAPEASTGGGAGRAGAASNATTVPSAAGSDASRTAESSPHAPDPPASAGTGTPDPVGSGAGGKGQSLTAADVWNRLGRPQAAYVMKNVRQEEQRVVTYNLTQAVAQAKTIAPQSFIQFLADPGDLNKHVHLVDLNQPFFQRLNIEINAIDVDFAAEGITQVIVQLRYGTRPDGTSPKDTAEAILRSREDKRDFTFFMDKNLTQFYEYKLIVDYQSRFAIGVDDPRVESSWIQTEARSLSIHPRWLNHMLPVTLQLAPSVTDDVSEVQSQVRYRNPARSVDAARQVRLTAQNRSETVRIRLADKADQFEVLSTFFYKDGTSEGLPPVRWPDAASGAAPEVLVISAPRANRLNGDIIMLDPIGELGSVLVDTQVSQDGNIVDSRSFELTTPGKREAWSVRLLKRDVLPKILYRERRIYKDGGLETEEWREALSPNLVVGIPAEGTLTVAVLYLGPKPSDIGLNAILLDLEYADPGGDSKFNQRATLLIDDDPTKRTQDWKVRLRRRDARTYRWRLTLLLANGSETKTDFRTDTRDKLILRPPQL